MTGRREELDICAIAHQIEIKNAFLNDLLSNTLYTFSNCNTKIGALQNQNYESSDHQPSLFHFGLGNCLVNRSIFASFP